MLRRILCILSHTLGMEVHHVVRIDYQSARRRAA